MPVIQDTSTFLFHWDFSPSCTFVASFFSFISCCVCMKVLLRFFFLNKFEHSEYKKLFLFRRMDELKTQLLSAIEN